MTTSTSNYTTWSCLTENWWLQISVTKCLSMCSLFHFDNNESMYLLDHYRTCILFPTLTNSICLYLCKFYVASMVSPCVNQPSISTKRRPSHYNNIIQLWYMWSCSQCTRSISQSQKALFTLLYQMSSLKGSYQFELYLTVCKHWLRVIVLPHVHVRCKKADM